MQERLGRRRVALLRDRVADHPERLRAAAHITEPPMHSEALLRPTLSRRWISRLGGESGGTGESLGAWGGRAPVCAERGREPACALAKVTAVFPEVGKRPRESHEVLVL